MPRRTSPRDCSRALWLLGLSAPVTAAELTAAYRARISQAHPDPPRRLGRARSEAANTLTRALNDARAVVADWIGPGGTGRPPRRTRRLLAAGAAPPSRRPAPVAAARGFGPATSCACGRTTATPAGGRHRVRDRDAPAWVVLEDGSEVPAERVRLAPFACPGAGSARARPSSTRSCDRARSASSTCAGSSGGRTSAAGFAARSRPARRPGSPRPACWGTSASSSGPNHAAAGHW